MIRIPVRPRVPGLHRMSVVPAVLIAAALPLRATAGAEVPRGAASSGVAGASPVAATPVVAETSAVAGTGSAAETAAPPAWIAVFPARDEAALRKAGSSIWDRDEGIVIGGADDAALKALAAQGSYPLLRIADGGEWIYVLSHDTQFAARTTLSARVFPLSPTVDLYLVPPDESFELPRTKPLGGFRGVPRIGLPAVKPHDADLGLEDSVHSFAANPLVTQLLSSTSQASWFQYVKDLSGENTVVINGDAYSILTRYSFAMYPTPFNNAFASEYLLDKGAGWGYTGVRETYNRHESGCSSQSTNVWQNIVFTIPGQIDISQHQQVLFITHHDSLSYTAAESFNYAPGADDAISGGAALIEALRLFRNYAFKNTVKIIFFSGEEQGLCGSTAYTRQPQHPVGDIWRVINMDQTAYDGDRNRWMDCYNWDVTNSPGSVALGDSFVQANLDYGPIISPANLFRPTDRMCQTDHCPFWTVGAAAIAITEDLMHNEICPCFDTSQSASCHDTVTQMDPSHPTQIMFDQEYSWPSEQAAIATVAHLAEPLYACPASAPVLTGMPDDTVVHLIWPAAPGVTHYVVERAAGCAGPFAPLLSVTGTRYDDTGLTNRTPYSYRLRTCPNQWSACVTVTPNSPSVGYQAGSATVTADSGDHDSIADNCELVTVEMNLVNDGSIPVTGAKVVSLGSSHGGVQIATQIPQGVGSLGVGESAPVMFKFYLGRNGVPAACGQNLTFDVSSSSDQSPLNTQAFTLSAEQDAAAPLVYSFDTTPQACDAQTNDCAALPGEVSPNGAPVALTIDKNGGSYDLRFSEATGATGYSIYGGSIQSLRTGYYDHVAQGGTCALIDGNPGDGQVAASVAPATFADNSYLLAVARNAAGESVYGHSSTGATIPIALASCP